MGIRTDVLPAAGEELVEGETDEVAVGDAVVEAEVAGGTGLVDELGVGAEDPVGHAVDLVGAEPDGGGEEGPGGHVGGVGHADMMTHPRGGARLHLCGAQKRVV